MESLRDRAPVQSARRYNPPAVKPARLVAVNLAAAAALLVFAALGAALALDLYALVRGPFFRDDRARSAAFAGIPGAEERFREMQRLETEFAPFAGWRYRPFRGATITIGDGGFRLHPADPADPPGAPVVGLFGGSTVWGVGVPDDGTLAAALDRRLPGVAVRNFGQTGYNSGQSLALLTERLTAGERLDLAVLFEGVNDVVSLCRADVALTGHGEEEVMRRRLRPPRSRLAATVLEPIAEAAALARRKLAGPPPTPWICDRDPARAEAVAETLLRHWEMAHAAAAARGVPVLAVVQPMAYAGAPNLEGLGADRHPGLDRQFAAVYPRLRAAAAARGRPWIVDLTAALDGGEPVYFDFCHVTERGNDRLAGALAERVAGAWPAAARAGGGG
jgi:lysophospholipase L1-like esterase